MKFYFIVFYRRKFVAQIQFKKVAFPFSKHLKFSIHRSKLSLLQFPTSSSSLLDGTFDPSGAKWFDSIFFTRGGGSEGVILLRTKDNFIVCIRLKKKKKRERAVVGKQGNNVVVAKQMQLRVGTKRIYRGRGSDWRHGLISFDGGADFPPSRVPSSPLLIFPHLSFVQRFLNSLEGKKKGKNCRQKIEIDERRGLLPIAKEDKKRKESEPRECERERERGDVPRAHARPSNDSTSFFATLVLNCAYVFT